MSPFRCNVQSSRFLVPGGSLTESLPSTIFHELFDILRCQTGQNVPEEGPLSLAIAVPLVGHVISEASQTYCLLPDPLNGKFRPQRNLQMLDIPLPEKAFLVAQDLLHEREPAGLQTGKIHLLRWRRKLATVVDYVRG